jgi:hypothetical protein
MSPEMLPSEDRTVDVVSRLMTSPEERRSLRRRPDDRNFVSLLVLAGAFLLVTWVAINGLFCESSCSLKKRLASAMLRWPLKRLRQEVGTWQRRLPATL